MPDRPDVPNRLAADASAERVVRRGGPDETWPRAPDGNVVAHPVAGGHRIRVRLTGTARRDSALRATSSWVEELGPVSSLDDDGEELSIVVAGGVGCVALACAILERVGMAADPYGALGRAAVAVEREEPQRPPDDATASAWRRWAGAATGTAADDEPPLEMPAPPEDEGEMAASEAPDGVDEDEPTPAEATERVGDAGPPTPEAADGTLGHEPTSREPVEGVAEPRTRRSVFETIGESAERTMVANNARSDGLPGASAPGLFDVELVDTGPGPDRTAALLAHVLGVPDAEAQRWCASVPFPIAAGVSAREARRIAVAVGSASGCTLRVSPAT